MTAGEFWVLQDDDRMQLKEAFSFVLMIRYHRVKGQRIRAAASIGTQRGEFLILFLSYSLYFRAPWDTLDPTIEYIYSCGFIVVYHIIIHLERCCPTQIHQWAKI